jgi:hypothetical protein
LLAHWVIRSLIFRASTTTNKSPLQFSFTGTLRILRRALPSSLPYFFSWLISEIADNRAVNNVLERLATRFSQEYHQEQQQLFPSIGQLSSNTTKEHLLRED